MRIPAFIKQLAKCCDSESSRYALGGVQCLSDGKTAQLTATDGHILASVYYPDEDKAKPVSAIVDGKSISSPPVAAFKKPVHFDGTTLRYDGKSETVEPVNGRFPRIEDIFDAVEGGTDGYVSVELGGSLLRKLADLAAAMSDDERKRGITLFVKDGKSCVFATCKSAGGHVARMAIMPLAADNDPKHTFPPRPGVAAAEEDTVQKPPTKKPESKRCATVIDTRSRTCRSVDGPTPAPVPEMMDAEQVAAAIADPTDWSADLAPIGA